MPVMARDGVCEGHAVRMQIADLNVGILYVFAIASTGVIGAAIAGWASDNKFSLLGGLRAASQMISYEVAMGLSLMGLLLTYSTLRFGKMVDWQNDNAWGIFIQPVAFCMFLAAAMAERSACVRPARGRERDRRRLLPGILRLQVRHVMAGEYVEVLTRARSSSRCLLGGTRCRSCCRWHPVTLGDAVLFDYRMNHVAVTLIQILTFFGKTLFFAWFQIFFRWTLPRFRYDQVMKFGWTKLLPLAIVNLVVTAIVVVAVDAAGPGFHTVLKILGQLSHLVARASSALPSVDLAAAPDREQHLHQIQRYPLRCRRRRREADRDASMSKPTSSTTGTKPRGTAITPKVVARPVRDLDVQSYLPAVTRCIAQTMAAFFTNTKEMVLGQKKDPVARGQSGASTPSPTRKRSARTGALPRPAPTHIARRLRALGACCAARRRARRNASTRSWRYPRVQAPRFERFPKVFGSTSCAASSALLRRACPCDVHRRILASTRCPTTRASIHLSEGSDDELHGA